MNICQICENDEGNKVHLAYEMMFGLRDGFEYIECAFCGCLHIKEIPQNLEKYYPSQYWAAKPNQKRFLASRNPAKSWLKYERTKFYLNQSTSIGALAAWVSSPPEIPIFSGWNWIKPFQQANINSSSALLDVGCGSGILLEYLKREGFSNLTGVDPFIQEDFFGKGIKILKKNIYQLYDKYDLIMLHHSFEHMPEPLKVLQQLNKLLKVGSSLIIRIPIVSYAWSKYGVFWVQLDAPRHFFLQTIKSMRILTEKAGFKVEELSFDSTEFQILGSEQYLKGIALTSPESHFKDHKNPLFSSEEIENAHELAVKLNSTNQGDQACFLMKKIDDIKLL